MGLNNCNCTHYYHHTDFNSGAVGSHHSKQIQLFKSSSLPLFLPKKEKNFWNVHYFLDIKIQATFSIFKNSVKYISFTNTYFSISSSWGSSTERPFSIGTEIKLMYIIILIFLWVLFSRVPTILWNHYQSHFSISLFLSFSRCLLFCLSICHLLSFVRSFFLINKIWGYPSPVPNWLDFKIQTNESCCLYNSGPI